MLANLEQRLAIAMANHKVEAKRMFGGVCYMVNGNMTVCASKRGLLVRVGPAASAKAAMRPGASLMEMRGKIMPGYVRVEDSAMTEDAVLKQWVKLSLAFNATLPAKLPKPAKAKKIR